MPVLLAAIGLIAVVLLTLGTALFVAAEFSLVAADRSELEVAARSGDKPAQRALAAVRTLSFQLSGAQLGITITTLAVGFLAEPALNRLFRPALRGIGLPDGALDTIGLILALFIATLLQMVFGELVPKNWAIAKPTHVARRVAAPMSAFTTTFKWIISACNRAANSIVRQFGIEPQEELRSARSPAELGSLVRTSADEGSLPGSTADLMARSLTFGARTAGEVMTPRTRTISLSESATVADLIAAARESGHSRFPLVADANRDDASVSERTAQQQQRVVHIKRAFAVPTYQRAATALREIAQPLPEVPDSLLLPPLLDLLRRPGSQMALVIDEYGGTAGIVTLEDLVEELVGEVDDEHDAPSLTTSIQADGSHVVPGLLRVDEAEELTGFHAPDGPYDTLGGLIMSELGRVAQTGDTVSIGAWTLSVEAIDGHRVETVRLSGPPAPADRPALADRPAPAESDLS
ncbi:MAG: hypothetical protein JWM76_670 [Pseudonocardiales bacterium]|nr:hypothetical protein [Pseudonocardiales bacterium]